MTGIDTGVGKTYVGRILVKALNKNGVSCIPRKPIETGCDLVNGEYQPEDALLYFKTCNEQYSLEEICPYRYEPPISPERAIRLVNQTVTVDDLANACQTNSNADVLYVEGAGGFYSPLCSNGLNADLAQKLNAEVILVVKDRLGCINQTLLTIEAIQNRNLNIKAIVLNQYRQHEESAMDNLEDLRIRLSTPIVAIPNMIDATQDMLDTQYQAIDELLDILT